MRLTAREQARSGPRNQKPMGSLEWCWQTLDLLKIRWQRKDFTDQQFEETLEELRRQEVWKTVPPEQPYGSLDALLEAEIGCTEQDARKQLEGQAHPKRGRPNKLSKFDNLNQEERAKRNGVSRYTQIKLDYLTGHREDLLHQYHNGALSLHAAYQQAKGHTPETPLDALLRAWRRVRREDRVHFLCEQMTEEELAELVGKLLARETHAARPTPPRKP